MDSAHLFIIETSPSSFISSDTLLTLGYTNISLNKISRTLTISSPIQDRLISVKDLGDSSILSSQKTFYPTFPISGYTKIMSQYSVTSVKTVLTLDSFTKLNYGSNILETSFKFNTLNIHNSILNSFSLVRQIHPRLSLNLGDVSYQDFSKMSLTPVSTLWGLNFKTKGSPKKRNLPSKVSNYQIFLSKPALIKIQINDSIYSSFYLSAGPHLLQDIPKEEGLNNIKVIAIYKDSDSQSEVLVNETFKYLTSIAPSGTWRLNIQYGYPYTLPSEEEKIRYGPLNYDPQLGHMGFNLDYQYSKISTSTLFKYGPNFYGLGLMLVTPTLFGEVISSYGYSALYSNYYPFLISHRLISNSDKNSPLMLSHSIDETSQNASISKSFLFFNFLTINTSYTLSSLSSFFKVSSSIKFEPLFSVSHSSTFSSSKGLSNQITFSSTFNSWNCNFSIISSPQTSAFQYLVSKRFKNTARISHSPYSNSLSFSLFSLSELRSQTSIINNSNNGNSINFSLNTPSLRMSSYFVNQNNIPVRNDKFSITKDNFSLDYSYTELSKFSTIQQSSIFKFETGLVFTGNHFAFYNGPATSFAIIKSKGNLKNQDFYIDDKQSNMFGTIVVPVNGEKSLTVSTPSASPWLELGPLSFNLYSNRFSGHLIEVGGVGTHATTFIFQDFKGNPIQYNDITITPLDTIVPIDDFHINTGISGRVVSLGFVLGSYKITFDNEDYGTLFFKITNRDPNFLRFGIINLDTQDKTIFPQSKDELLLKQKKIIDTLYQTDSTDPSSTIDQQDTNVLEE